MILLGKGEGGLSAKDRGVDAEGNCVQEEEVESELVRWALCCRAERDLSSIAIRKIQRKENALSAVLISSAVATFNTGPETRHRAARVNNPNSKYSIPPLASF